MRSLTRFVLRHKALVVAFWLVVAFAGGATAGTTTSRLSTTFDLPGQPSTETSHRIDSAFHTFSEAPPIVPVVTLPAGTTLDTPGVSAQLMAAFATAHVLPGLQVVDGIAAHDAAFVTRDGRSVYALVFGVQPSFSGGTDPAIAITRAITAAIPTGWTVRTTGLVQLSSGGGSGGESVLVEAMIGAVGALVILTFVFASFLAVLPLLTAGISIMTTFLLVLALTTVTSVSFIVQFLIALIGLGVAIDYSLLLVTRWREERAHGKDSHQAVEDAMVSAGRAVLFSGATVAIGLLALVVLPVPFLRSIGIGGVLIPLVSVAVATTLLPVLLATIGPRLDWPRLRHEAHASRPWTAWASLVLRRRWVAAGVGALLLALLAIPALSLHAGQPTTTSLAQSGDAYDALQTLERGGVPSGVITPMTLLTTGGDPASVVATIKDVPGIFTAIAPSGTDSRLGADSLITVLPRDESSTTAGKDALTAVRSAVANDHNVFGVTGDAAFEVDFNHAVYGSFPLMLSIIALLTLALLARAFRSLLLAAKAVVLNLISLACAFGVLTLVFQDGHGSDTIWGIPPTGAITIWVPVMVFAFLFGLSMDYEVFILSRMREAYDQTGSTESAVVTGLGRTGRLVTSAALIMMFSFVAMSTAPDTDIKILATGLGAGIIVDATVIRTLMVPALVSLFGRFNWWLPVWAGKVLRVAPSPLMAARPAVKTAA